MKAYRVKEAFYTLCGEGANSGRPAVFVRFSGCNLWSGREADRLAAICSFCDTDFSGTDGDWGGRYDASRLADLASELWPGGARLNPGLADQFRPLVVLTGGEPMLQVDRPLVAALHLRNFEVAVETNGTLAVPDSVDWICVSPKSGAPLVQTRGQELKLVFPQPGIDPANLLAMSFGRFYLQPKDEPGMTWVSAATEYVLSNPRWRLSLQSHKFLGIR